MTDKRLQATLYHESIHVKQFDKGLRGNVDGESVQPLQEFHAHNRELRHAMKNNLYTAEDRAAKLLKINKYATKTKEAFPDLSGSVDKQLNRIADGHKPKKHGVSYWKGKLGL